MNVPRRVDFLTGEQQNISHTRKFTNIRTEEQKNISKAYRFNLPPLFLPPDKAAKLVTVVLRTDQPRFHTPGLKSLTHSGSFPHRDIFIQEPIPAPLCPYVLMSKEPVPGIKSDQLFSRSPVLNPYPSQDAQRLLCPYVLMSETYPSLKAISSSPVLLFSCQKTHRLLCPYVLMS